jgi:6-pyruvoyl-tetrahydropterin synthase
LDERNWVVDFVGLKALKQVLEKQFDHTLCIAGDDPLLNNFQQLHQLGAVDLRIMPRGVGIERTAEWCFDVADSHVRGITNNRCWVSKVEVWEHDKNSAIVSVESCMCSCGKHTAKVNAEQFELPFDQKPIENVKVESNTNTTGNAPGPTPAAVGNTVTSGWSNPLGGTSWGL